MKTTIYFFTSIFLFVTSISFAQEIKEDQHVWDVFSIAVDAQIIQLLQVKNDYDSIEIVDGDFVFCTLDNNSYFHPDTSFLEANYNIKYKRNSSQIKHIKTEGVIAKFHYFPNGNIRCVDFIYKKGLNVYEGRWNSLSFFYEKNTLIECVLNENKEAFTSIRYYK
ncbi:hypothetical protein SAMN05216474_1819 [Lishizhenia tianjinensis]|uniref:MORN repeat variant n=1 Tax=Lishizhenia tianjinensis TaxID=477690 RepID=A0A1I7A1S6_9FLAO|nr:hypothetical protein [Lishizhenia tianjinensis]SFT68851.1 hypothetical protein SAMN05216474_1819 [Lishizhenia tianjinensis]